MNLILTQSLQWLGKNYVVIFRHLEAVNFILEVILSKSLWIGFHIIKKTILLHIRRHVPPSFPFKSALG